MGDDRIRLCGARGEAVVHLVGATVLSWTPAGGADRLWVAPAARFEDGRAIRGGVPLCWPWFAGSPAHGLVRHRRWALLDADTADGDAWAELGVDVDEAGWSFQLRLRVRVGDELVLQLVHDDRSGRPTRVGGAFHTYLRLDAARASVHGLAGEGLDKLTGALVPTTDPQPLRGPLDRVVPHRGAVDVTDDERPPLRVEGRNTTDVVLWNPADRPTSDLSPDDAARFACVEAAVVGAPHAVEPNGRCTVGLRLSERRAPASGPAGRPARPPSR